MRSSSARGRRPHSPRPADRQPLQPPGGNVEPAEDFVDEFRRELAEELRLDLNDATEPELCWIQDQRVTRPGPTLPPRKIHLTFRNHVEVERFFTDLELLAPGVVPVNLWRPGPGDPNPTRGLPAYAAVAQKR